MPKPKPVTPQQLRKAARDARRLQCFLERCNDQRVFDTKGGWIMGFDLDMLSDWFDEAAQMLEVKDD